MVRMVLGSEAARMNASSPSEEDNGIYESDSDSNSDDSSDYYQPISTVEGGGGEDEDGVDFSNEDQNPNFHHLPNGWSENGVSPGDINNDDNEDEKGEEEATESNRAIQRAFREDERRRNAPLTAENAVRVMDAMRQITFGGGTPDWAAEVSEGQWIDQLRRLRSPSLAAAAASDSIDN